MNGSIDTATVYLSLRDNMSAAITSWFGLWYCDILGPMGGGIASERFTSRKDAIDYAERF